MVKLATLLLLLCSLPVASFAEYEGNSRTIPLQAFQDRFTMGELIDISTAYAEDAYIRSVVLTLSDMGSVDLDSPMVKNSMGYLTSKSIISMDRVRDILK
jgi:predicted amino acid-binding ACT domain protein